MKKLRLPILITILAVMIVHSSAQPVKVSGTAPGAAGYMVRLIMPEDLVSMKETTIASAVVSEKGNFSLQAEIENVRYGYIDIDMQRAEIYLVPGEEIRLEISFNPSTDKAFFEREPLPIEVQDSGVNRDIRTLNEYYNRFILDHFNEIYKEKKKYLVDTLSAQLHRMFPDPANKYFLNYIRYKIAGAEQFSGRMSRKALAEEYLLGEPVLYDNIEYDYFFGEFFEKYLLTGSKVINVATIARMLEEKYSPGAFIDSITRDPLLSDPVLAEYFLLRSLKGLYYIPEFEKEDVIRVLKELAENSNQLRHRQIAKNIIEELSRLSKGQPAPFFELPSVDGEMVSLNDLKGDIVYLFFFQSNSPVSIHEMQILQEKMIELGPGIKLVGISADRNAESLSKLSKDQEFPFILVHYDGNLELLERYDATTFPLFMILDKEGRIMQYPAPWPGENAVEILNGLR